MGGPSPDDSGVAIGTVIGGRYRIAGLLGRGGMGRVYRGEHTAIGKTVAVKVLQSALGRNQEAALRFQREAIASGRLDHPNIVSVMDFGILDDGCLYLVMEALDGEHLGQRLAREKRIAWHDALVITRSVLLGLRHAHERGVVHRDVKPDNIFLANKDGEAIVKVLDFGIAKLYAGNSDDPMATRAGITVGTPTYLSPEQATGAAITPASDIYSTSIVLYEMLVGRAPYESDDPLALLTSHVGGTIPAFRELVRDLDVPDTVEPLVRRGLTKAAADRIGSAEYVQTIDEILRAEGIQVSPAPLSVRASQSIGIPVGPFGVATSTSGGTPLAGMLTPSPGFLATATPFPALSRAATATKEPSEEARPVQVPPPNASPSHRRRWLAIAALAAVACVVVAAISLHHDAKTSQAQPVATTPVRAQPVSPPTADSHDMSLKAALHDLEQGATCADRKNAIARLVELDDPKAIPAIKKARARGKVNACLRSAATKALDALGSAGSRKASVRDSACSAGNRVPAHCKRQNVAGASALSET